MKTCTAIVLLSILAVGCGSSDSPTAPTPITPTTLTVQGNLSVQGCQNSSSNGLFSCTLFSGVIINAGSGCAQNVRGTTTVALIAGNQQIGAQSWSYGNVVRPGEQFAYNGGPILVAGNGLWVYTTVPAWDNVRCP